MKPKIITMRLITRDAGADLSLIERTGADIPPYAILSHTWDGDNEVSFSDIIDGTGKDKPRYAKLEFCVEQAARDGLQYSWIDTCCIDRWNLQELSTSINSMFSWYQNAKKCYVLLIDAILPSSLDETAEPSRWRTTFCESR